MRRAWLRTSEGGPSLFCVCARACVCKHTCVHTGSRCKTDFLLGLESKNKHSLEHSVSNFHYILVTKLHFCGTLVLKPQKESLWPRRWDVPVHPGSPSSSHPRGSPNSHSDSASQESRQGVTCAPSGPGPPGPLGFPGWQRVCFPRNSTLQGCQAGPRGRFCAFPALHAPGEDSEVTWQLGRFLPAPSVPVALAIARSKWGVSFWDPVLSRKQSGSLPHGSSQGPWPQAVNLMGGRITAGSLSGLSPSQTSADRGGPSCFPRSPFTYPPPTVEPR